MNAYTTVAAAAALALGGLFGVAGDGTIKEERRAPGDFHAVEVGAWIQAKVTLGEPASLTLEADANLLPLLTSEVKDGVLVLEAKESMRPSRPIRATLVAPRLDSVAARGGARVESAASPGARLSLRASGGASVEVTGVAVEELSVEASGGATVKAEGEARRLDARASGGATVRAPAAALEKATVAASGGAHIWATVKGEITGSASGGSKIHLKGRPALQVVSTSGGARVVRE